ncbi:MAG: hypothetical protein ABR529_00760 [Actinomycetota bacterium]
MTDAMPAKIHLTVPRPFRGRRQGVVLHHAPLEGNDRTVRAGVPITTVARTLADLARTSDPRTVATAAEQALNRELVSARRLRKLAADDEILERTLAHLLSRAG